MHDVHSLNKLDVMEYKNRASKCHLLCRLCVDIAVDLLVLQRDFLSLQAVFPRDYLDVNTHLTVILPSKHVIRV